jgi:polar amino acid transport system substrate-binding protein
LDRVSPDQSPAFVASGTPTIVVNRPNAMMLPNDSCRRRPRVAGWLLLPALLAAASLPVGPAASAQDADATNMATPPDGSAPVLDALSGDPREIWQPTPGAPGSRENPLEILLAPRPPFAFKDELGQWDGLSISLWREIAERLQIEFVLVETTLEQVARAVREGTGSSIIGVAITPERAKSSFLTHAFESSGVGIATRERIGLLPSISASLQLMEVMQMLLLLVLLFFIAAILIWICERRHAVKHFHPSATRGIPDGMWWSVVTFATIGYGDKVPQTIAGRIVAATWILFSVVLVALFTGIIASRITLTAGAYVVSGVDDLARKRVGAVEGTLTSTILRRMSVPFEPFESDPVGVEALSQGRLDAFLSDYAVLHYYVAPLRDQGLRVLPHPIARDFLALSFSRSLPSNLLEAIDVAMLQEIASPDWTWVRHRYLGLLFASGEGGFDP